MAAEITASSDVSGLTMQVTANIVGYKSVTWNVKVDGKCTKKIGLDSIPHRVGTYILNIVVFRIQKLESLCTIRAIAGNSSLT